MPLVDVSRSRASRTRCAAARRLRAGATIEGSLGSCTTSGLSAGLLINQQKSCTQPRQLFCGNHFWRQIVKTGLKEPDNRVNNQLKMSWVGSGQNGRIFDEAIDIIVKKLDARPRLGSRPRIYEKIVMINARASREGSTYPSGARLSSRLPSRRHRPGR